MKERVSERIPVIPPENHPYMLDLYGRYGLDVTAEQSVVLGAAHHLWHKADSVGERVEAGELLLGRRIDGNEINTLPFDFSSRIFDGGDFSGMLEASSRIVESKI